MNDTVFYIVVFLVIAHFLAGFIFLVRKLSGPVKEDREDMPDHIDPQTDAQEVAEP